MTKELKYLKDEEVDSKKLLLKLLRLIKAYFILFVVCILAGIFGSVGFYFSKIPVYESQMIINSDIIDYATVNEIIKTLDKLIQEKNYEEVAKRISLDIEQTAKVKSMEVNDIYEYNEKNKMRLFQISIMIVDNQLLTELQNRIVKYLEENAYVKKRINLKKENIKTRIQFFQKEIDQIDSLKKRIENRGLIRDNSNNLLLFDPVSVYQELVILFERKLELEKDLELADNFQVMEGFTSFQKPVSPQLTVYLLTGFISGIFIGTIILIFLELKSFARKNEI